MKRTTFTPSNRIKGGYSINLLCHDTKVAEIRMTFFLFYFFTYGLKNGEDNHLSRPSLHSPIITAPPMLYTCILDILTNSADHSDLPESVRTK